MKNKMKLSNGLEISYYDSGSGRPIVFAHSFSHTKAMWFPQLGYFLNCGYRVIAHDMRGYGETELTEMNYTIRSLSDDTTMLISELGLRSPILVGISMGGYIALDILERNPDLLGGVVLSNTKAEADTEEIKARRRAQITLLKERGVKEFVEQNAPERLSKKTLDEKPWVLDAVKMMNLSVTAETLVSSLQSIMEKKDNTSSLSRISVPTLITYGTEDTFIPKGAAPLMNQEIRGSRLVPIEGTGHVSSLEDPAQYNAALLGLLSEIKGESPL